MKELDGRRRFDGLMRNVNGMLTIISHITPGEIPPIVHGVTSCQQRTETK